MNKKTIEEKVKAFFNEYWREFCEDLDYKISIEWKTDRLEIVVINMYRYFSVSSASVVRFMNAIGATKCNMVREEPLAGCETCGYGSEYPIALICWGWK